MPSDLLEGLVIFTPGHLQKRQKLRQYYVKTCVSLEACETQATQNTFLGKAKIESIAVGN